MNSMVVTMYRCGQCSRDHQAPKLAEACCICQKCKTRPVRYDKRMGASADCELCLAKSNLRYAQERQREAVKRMKDADESLEIRKTELTNAKERYGK